MSKIEITNNIRRLRFDRGEMTQQELADSIGVTRQTVNAIELGKYSPSLEVAFRIAHTFDVNLEEVFQFVVDGKPHESTPGTQGRRRSGRSR